jgi:hypothetical protein
MRTQVSLWCQINRKPVIRNEYLVVFHTLKLVTHCAGILDQNPPFPNPINISMLVQACHSKHSLLWSGTGSKPHHIFEVPLKQEQQLWKKWQTKQQHVTRYSFRGPFYTLLSSGLHSGVHTCCPDLTWVLSHWPTSWWPYPSIEWNETCCCVLLQNYLHHASYNREIKMTTCQALIL